MNRYLIAAVSSLAAWCSTALAQDGNAAGTVLPIPPQAAKEIASRFMFEVRNAEWADDAENQIESAIADFDSESTEVRVDCKATICRATLQVRSPDVSAIWRVESKTTRLSWETRQYQELAELAGFERVTELMRALENDGRGTVYLFFSQAEYRPGFVEAN